MTTPTHTSAPGWAADYHTGTSLQAIAARSGVSATTVARHLRARRCLSAPTKKGWENVDTTPRLSITIET